MQEATIADRVARMRNDAAMREAWEIAEDASLIERQQQVIDTLVEALRPFAALTACLECVVPSTETVTIEVRQGDLVGALAAVMLAEAKQNPNRAREAKVEAERILDHSHPGLKREKE